MKKLIAVLTLLLTLSASAFASNRSVEEVTNRAFGGESWADGRTVVTTAATPVQLSATSTKFGTLTICAETNNTGIITVGASTVVGAVLTRRGVPLAAGDCYSPRNGGDLNALWLDTTVNGDGVTYHYGV